VNHPDVMQIRAPVTRAGYAEPLPRALVESGGTRTGVFQISAGLRMQASRCESIPQGLKPH
jgi:hypothetical protein